MARVGKVLGQAAPAAATDTDIYTVPEATEAVVSSIVVANRDAAWKIVYLHHPPYTSGPHGGVSEDGVPHEKGVRHGRQHLAPLFTSEEVDVVFAGHDHCYERSHYGNVVYVTSGGGGAPLYDPVNAHTNPGSAIFVKAWHYVEVNVDGETLAWTARDAEGKEIDRYELRK